MDGPVSSQFKYVTWRIKTYYSAALDICLSRSILNIQDMDDLSHALTKALLKELKCPVCMEYMVPPIKLCMNGHNICSKRRERVQCCPTCRDKFSEIRNVALENIPRRQKLH